MCQFCEKPFNDMCQDVGTDSFRLAEWDGDWHIETYADFSGPINYCPMCGRKFKDEKLKIEKEEYDRATLNQ